MKLKINYKYNVPFIAGYNMSGTVIYIDKRLPKVIPGTKIAIEKYLAVHEELEQRLEDMMGFSYPEAHAIATAAELAAVKHDGYSAAEVKAYNDFYKTWTKSCRQSFDSLPADLDLDPYIQSKEHELLKRMKDVQPELPITKK